ncbi:MAG: transglycosylase SLT domain-containing protein [Pelagimonas sp.]
MLRAAILFTLLAAQATANPGPTPLESAPVGDTAVAAVPSKLAVTASLRPVARRVVRPLPNARWGSKGGRASWTRAIQTSLRSHASVLTEITPRDIAAYCPAYPSASREQREDFWVGLVSSLAWHESTHRPHAVGGGGLWYGLVQILPDTARRYKCKARSGQALKNPEDNLSCAMRIMAVTVPRDQVISENWRGVAADWGPFHSSRKRNDMKEWTRKQDYCIGLSSSLRPVARPDGIGPDPIRPQARPFEMQGPKPVPALEAVNLDPAQIISEG